MPFPISEQERSLIYGELNKKRIPIVEAVILDLLRGECAKTTAYFAVLALRDVGTKASIPLLKELLHHPMQDVKDCSILTIAHIAGAEETEFYVEALRDKRTKKTYPMWAIADAADERAIDAVIEYTSKTIKSKSISHRQRDTLAMAVAYMKRFKEKDDRIPPNLDRITVAVPDLREWVNPMRG